ncbi:MAG TPA: hypothetical protein VFJ58_02040 [Armatimonadota bacterium]|nr:hypothetical protein [Armatimonadota bacterium]
MRVPPRADSLMALSRCASRGRYPAQVVSAAIWQDFVVDMSEDTAVAEPLLCRRCGVSHGPEARFCQQCGAKLPIHHPAPAPSTPAHPPINPARVREQVERLTHAAQAAREAGQTLEAEAICSEALKLDPAAIPPRTMRAELLEEEGKFAAAVLDVQDLVRLDPDRRSYRRWYTRLRRRMYIVSPSRRVRPAWSGFIGALILCWMAIAALAAIGFLVIWSPSTRSDKPSVTQVGAPGGAALTGLGAGNGALAAPARSESLAAGSSVSPSLTGPGPLATSSLSNVAPPLARPVPVRRTAPSAAIILPPARVPARSVSRAEAPPAPPAPLAPIFVSPAPAPAPTAVVPAAPSADPSFKAALSQAQTNFSRGDYGKAILDYNHALAAAPTVLDSARVHQQIGMAYSSMGAPREARDQYATAQQLYSNLLSGPDADVAKQAIQTLQRQQQMLDSGQ